MTNSNLKRNFIIILKKLDAKNSNSRTMIYTLLLTGLHPPDIINIRVEDVGFQNNLLRYISHNHQNYFPVIGNKLQIDPPEIVDITSIYSSNHSLFKHHKVPNNRYKNSNTN